MRIRESLLLNAKEYMKETRNLTYVFVIAMQLLLAACGNGDRPEASASETVSSDNPKHRSDTLTAAAPIEEHITKADTAIEVMEDDDIRLNGKLKRYFSLREFGAVLGEPDSSKLLRDEEPCTTIFQEADGSVDPQAKYLFKRGSRFESTKGKVAVDEVKFNGGDFIVFKGITFNNRTTMAQLRHFFPNAAKHIGTMTVAGEGELHVIQLREDKNNVSDGHIKLFIKNGMLYSLHWWFPC